MSSKRKVWQASEQHTRCAGQATVYSPVVHLLFVTPDVAHKEFVGSTET